MGRWDFDDEARSPEAITSRAPERAETTQRDHEPHINPLPDRMEPRARDGSESARGHDLTLPAGRGRESVRHEGGEYHLRGSEVDLLERAGRFRVTFTEDLKRDAGNDSRYREDLRSLQRQGLIDERTVTRIRDRAVADVVSVTRAGREVLDGHRDPDRNAGQVYYSGWVKPSEVWHDASLFRMVREAERALDHDGGRVQRVVLDDELKARAFRALHDAQDGQRSDAEAHRVVAEAQHLPLDGDHFVFPDVRLEVEYPDGTVRTVDLELVTEHYHRGHLSGKASAGFRMFGGRSGGAKGGSPQDPRTMGRLLR